MKFILFVSFLFVFFGISFGQHAYGYGSTSSVVHDNVINFAGGVEDLMNEVEPSPLHPFMLQLVVSSNVTSPLALETIEIDPDFWKQGAYDFTPNARFFSNSHAQDHYDYIYGGILDNGDYSSNFYRYDKNNRFWEQLYPNVTNGQQPGPLAHHCSVLDGNRLVLTGGLVSQDEMSEHIYHIDLTDLNSGWTKLNRTHFDADPNDLIVRAGHWCYFGDSATSENVIFIGEGFRGNSTYSEYAGSMYGFSISDDSGALIGGATPAVEEGDWPYQRDGCDDVGSTCTTWPQYDSSNNDEVRFGHWGFASDFYYNRESETTFFVITGGFNIYVHVNGTNRYAPATNNTFVKWISDVPSGAAENPMWTTAYDDSVSPNLGDGTFGGSPDEFDVRAQHVAFEYNFQIYISAGRTFDTWNYTGSWDEIIHSPFCDLWIYDPVSWNTEPYQHEPSILPLYDTEYATNPRYVRWPLGYIDGAREDLGALAASHAVASFATVHPFIGSNLGYYSFDSNDILGKQIAYQDLYGLNSGKFLTFFESGQTNSKRDYIIIDEISQLGTTFKAVSNPIITKYEESEFSPSETAQLSCFAQPHIKVNIHSNSSDACFNSINADDRKEFLQYSGCLNNFDPVFKREEECCIDDEGLYYELFCYICEFERILSEKCYIYCLHDRDIADHKDHKDIAREARDFGSFRQETKHIVASFLANPDNALHIRKFMNEVDDHGKRALEAYASVSVSASFESHYAVSDYYGCGISINGTESRSCSFHGKAATIQQNTCISVQKVKGCSISSIARGSQSHFAVYAPISSLGTNLESFFAPCEAGNIEQSFYDAYSKHQIESISYVETELSMYKFLVSYKGLLSNYHPRRSEAKLVEAARDCKLVCDKYGCSCYASFEPYDILLDSVMAQSCYIDSFSERVEEWDFLGLKYYTNSNGEWVGCGLDGAGDNEFLCFEDLNSYGGNYMKDWKYVQNLIERYGEDPQFNKILELFATRGLFYGDEIRELETVIPYYQEVMEFVSQGLGIYEGYYGRLNPQVIMEASDRYNAVTVFYNAILDFVIHEQFGLDRVGEEVDTFEVDQTKFLEYMQLFREFVGDISGGAGCLNKRMIPFFITGPSVKQYSYGGKVIIDRP